MDTEAIIQKKEFILKTLLNSTNHRTSVNFFLDANDPYPVKYHALNQLSDEGLINDISTSTAVWLTEDGIAVAKTGYIKYLEQQRQQADKELALKILEQDKLRLEVRQLSFTEKTKWLPHILSAAALIVSLIALIVSLK